MGSTIANVQAVDVTAKQLDAKARSIDVQIDFDVMQQRRQNKFFLGQANADATASWVCDHRGQPVAQRIRVKHTEIQAQNIRASGQNAAASTQFQSQMPRRQIPFHIIGGVAQAGGTILSSMQENH